MRGTHSAPAGRSSGSQPCRQGRICGATAPEGRSRGGGPRRQGSRGRGRPSGGEEQRPGMTGAGARSPPPALGGSLGRRGGTRQRGRRRTCTREQAVGGAWGKRTAEDGKRNRSSSFCSARGGYRKQDSQPSKIQSLLDPSFDKVSLFLANSSNIREVLEMLLNISN